MNADENRILDAVEVWAPGSVLLRNIGAGLGVGRPDGLLVPTANTAHCMKMPTDLWFWDQICIGAVEVKATRADFQAGLRKKQYTRYRDVVHGLYLATYPGVCLAAEIPKGIGHLVISKSGDPATCHCKRHPKWDRTVKLPEDTAWRCIFAIHSACQAKLDAGWEAIFEGQAELRAEKELLQQRLEVSNG